MASSSSSTLSSFKLSSPFFSQRNNGVRPPPSAFVPVRTRSTNVKSMAVSSEGRDNLDHLQRTNRLQQQQQGQARKKTPTQAAPVGLWDRFPSARTVQQMMDTMERLIEDPTAYNTTATWAPPREDLNGGYRRGRTPWEIKEVANEYKIRFDMPGMTKSDVKVWVEEKMLVVKGEKAAKENGEGKEGQEEEVWPAKSYGKYSSRIALPENVEFEKIKAEVRDGVLYISIPKVSVSAKVLDIQVQ